MATLTAQLTALLHEHAISSAHSFPLKFCRVGSLFAQTHRRPCACAAAEGHVHGGLECQSAPRVCQAVVCAHPSGTRGAVITADEAGRRRQGRARHVCESLIKCSVDVHCMHRSGERLMKGGRAAVAGANPSRTRFRSRPRLVTTNHAQHNGMLGFHNGSHES